MPDCPVCSFDNPRSAATCANCGAELGGADALATAPVTVVPEAGAFASAGPPGGTRAPAPVQSWPAELAQTPVPAAREPEPRPTVVRRKGADLALETAELQVDAGSAVATSLTVHNLGEEVERFTVEVNGPAGSFADAEPAELRMLPDKKQGAVVRFSPPRDPRVRAGTYPFQVVVRSTVNPDVVQRSAGAVTVAAFAELGAVLRPEVTRGRHPGRHTFEIVNSGNAPVAVEVALHDESSELVFDPQTFGGRLEPGQRVEHPVDVGGPVPWFGRTKAFPFTAEVSSTGRPQPLELRAQRRQLPRLPWWIPTVALALVGVAIAVIALLPKATLPNVVGLKEADAISQLKQAGYRPVAIVQPNKDIAKGSVFDTNPKAGSRLKHGQAATVYVSQGACAPCPILVPNVVGLQLDEATTQLKRAGLTARQLPKADTSPANTVLESEPAPNAPAGADKVVTLSVSTGPASASGSAGASGAGGAAAAGAGAAVAGLVIPNLIGRTPGDASTALQQAGLGATVVTQRTDSQPAGTVFAEDPKPGQAAQAHDKVTLTVAVPTADLVAGAPSGKWTANGTALTFPTSAANEPPAARVLTGATVVDGTTGTVLLTQPVPVTGQVTGDIPVTGGILPGDHLVAQVGFLQGSDGTVDFIVTAGGKQLGKVTANATDTTMTTLDVDLSGAAGNGSVQITAMASSGSTGQAYEAVWKDLRVSAGGK